MTEQKYDAPVRGKAAQAKMAEKPADTGGGYAPPLRGKAAKERLAEPSTGVIVTAGGKGRRRKVTQGGHLVDADENGQPARKTTAATPATPATPAKPASPATSRPVSSPANAPARGSSGITSSTLPPSATPKKT